MQSNAPDNGTKVLAISIVIALLGVGAGAYFAVTSGRTTTQTVVSNTATSTVTLTTITTTAFTISGGQGQPKVSTINVGGAPQGFAFNPTNNKVYVALENSSSVAVINGTTNTLLTMISLPKGSEPIALAYDSSNNMVYVASNNASAIFVINSADDALGSPIAVSHATDDIAVDSTTNVLCAVSVADYVYFVNTSTNSVITLQSDTGWMDNAHAVAIDTLKNGVFVGAYFGKGRAVAGLHFVNGSSPYSLIRTLNITGGQIDSVGINPNTGTLYVAAFKANSVNAVSESGKLIANITIPSPYGVAVDPQSNLVYAVSSGSNTLYVISGSTYSLLGTVTVGNGPVRIGINTNTNRIYVSNQLDGTISVIDGTSLLF